MSAFKRWILGACLALVGLPWGAQADQVRVAVASNFTAPAKALARAFEARTAHRVALSFGASGQFYAQLTQGAPFDLFFSADSQKPAALVEDGLALPASRIVYAVGRLALWTPQADQAPLQTLQGGQFRKLALANPRLAPYGKAARQTLQNLALTDTRGRWVRGQNIAQAYQFVATGNAELGFVAASQITREGELTGGSVWWVPADHHAPIRQGAVQMSSARAPGAARAFLQFVRTDEARQLIERYGYRTP